MFKENMYHLRRLRNEFLLSYSLTLLHSDPINFTGDHSLKHLEI